MPRAWLWTMLVVLMAGLFAGGLIIGLAVNQPGVSALRAETEEQRDELTNLQTRTAEQDSRLALLSAELGDVKAERSSLSVSLEASQSTVRDMQDLSARLSSELRNSQTQLNRSESSLRRAEERNHGLQMEALALLDSQRDLTLAIDVLSDLKEITNTQLGPNHGDALLLIEEGQRAANNNNYREAAAFFSESSRAFELAKSNVEEAARKSEELAGLVPEQLHQTFTASHRQSQSSIFVMEAQARTYEAVDYLYTIISEWTVTKTPSTDDRNRWRSLANMAEDRFEVAMGALDEADTWSLGLWRRTEALRLNVRDWRNLLRSIRFNVIDASQN